jgi:hypothetical protein
MAAATTAKPTRSSWPLLRSDSTRSRISGKRLSVRRGRRSRMMRSALSDTFACFFVDTPSACRMIVTGCV